MKKKVIISLIVVVIAAVLICLPGLFLKSKSSKKETQKPEKVSPDVIWEDYSAGKITIDDYVKKNIDNPSDYVNIDLFVSNNMDKLSESTLTYYLDSISLKNVTFDLDKENDEPKSSNYDLFAKPVYAYEELTNLNQVVLSSERNFVVWYTTTGESAITKEEAESIADGLEDSIKKYKDAIDYYYYFEPTVLAKYGKYRDQQRVLEANDINTAYLDDRMQVYVLNYDDDNENSLARYVSRRVAKKTTGIAQRFFGHDSNDSVILPYILIRPSSISNSERAKQVLNHELFHHYQFEVLEETHPTTDDGILLDLRDTPILEIKDSLIFDATANWASALITPHDTIEGFLNEHAHTARKYADRLLSDEMIDEYGKDGLSYSLFVYLYNYSTYVDNGTNKILESIFKEDSFKYLYTQATYDELARVQEEVALRDLSQDYENKNLIAAPSMQSVVPMKDRFLRNSPAESHAYESNLSPFAIEFYTISCWQSMTKDDLSAKIEKSNNVAAFLIRYKDGKYEVIDRATTNNDAYEFDITGDDVFYLAVANISGYFKSEYKLTISPAKKTDPSETDPGDTNARPTGPDDLTPVPDESMTELQETKKGVTFLSYETTTHWNEEILRDIETYYFDENGFVCGRTVTLYIAEEEGLMDTFVRNVTDSYHLYTNVKIEGNMLQYDYTDFALEETHDNERSKEMIIHFYEGESGKVDGYVRTDYNPYG